MPMSMEGDTLGIASVRTEQYHWLMTFPYWTDKGRGCRSSMRESRPAGERGRGSDCGIGIYTTVLTSIHAAMQAHVQQLSADLEKAQEQAKQLESALKVRGNAWQAHAGRAGPVAAAQRGERAVYAGKLSPCGVCRQPILWPRS